jgi:hypothetical protein
MIKLATCFLAASLLAACQTTSSTTASNATGRQTMQSRLLAQNAGAASSMAEPAPPAEGPEDVPAEGTVDPNRNPGLLPTPLLRASAAGSL